MLLSVSFSPIYEMQPEIQKLDDEFANKFVGTNLEQKRDLTKKPTGEEEIIWVIAVTCG